MNSLSVTLTLTVTLSVVVTPVLSVPLNSTVVTGRSSLCDYRRQQAYGIMGAFVPECDPYGDFEPRQCWRPRGFCWCVNIITGEEVPNTRTPIGSTPVVCDGEFYCPKGWSRFGKQCFIFINNPKSWAEAESYCLFEDANLASVHSPEANHFVQALTRGPNADFPQTWIGGNDAIRSNFWMWSDGSRFIYENWSKDYLVQRTDHCLIMNYGFNRKWDYASCAEDHPFVCAKTI